MSNQTFPIPLQVSSVTNTAVILSLSEPERRQLEQLEAEGSVPAKVLLDRAGGMTRNAVARKYSETYYRVNYWEHCLRQGRWASLVSGEAKGSRFECSAEDLERLESIDARPARAICERVRGASQMAVRARYKVRMQTVQEWERMFREGDWEGLSEKREFRFRLTEEEHFVLSGARTDAALALLSRHTGHRRYRVAKELGKTQEQVREWERLCKAGEFDKLIY